MPLEKLEAVTDTPVSNPQAAAVRATANQQEIDSVRVDSGLGVCVCVCEYSVKSVHVNMEIGSVGPDSA